MRPPELPPNPTAKPHAESTPDRAAPVAAARFDGRADDYVRGRPGYPEALFDELVRRAGLGPGARVADLGAGTGIASAPLLARGCMVFAVEPNAQMRAAAEAQLGNSTAFHAVAGSAEATGLPDRSIELALAAQAFHWFDPERTRSELARILRPGGQVALIWNARRATGTPFLAAYEDLLRRFGTDYEKVGHRGVGRERLARFYGHDTFDHLRFDYHQRLDQAGLRARLLSSSYLPHAGTPTHATMLAALDTLFSTHATGGLVTLEYDTDLFLGPLAAP